MKKTKTVKTKHSLTKKKTVKREKRKKVKRKPKSVIQRDWYLFDCQKQPLGRLATKIAEVLIGKHKVSYTPYWDGGDFAVVVNAENVYLTGKKAESKFYYRHTGYPGGLKRQSFPELLRTNPKRLVYRAVARMLPVNSLRAKRLKRLKIFTDGEHPYQKKVKEFKS
jgi:large subunit ribosomal protein L13